MNNRSHKSAIWILCSLIVVLGVFLGFDVYNIQQQNRETSDLLNHVNEREGQKILSQDIRLIQNNEKENIESLDKSVLTEERLVIVFENLEDAAQKLGLSIDIDADENKTVTTDPHQFELTLNTVGSWSNTLAFLHALENLPYRFDISSTQITKSDTAWRSNFKIVLYAFKN